MLCSRTEVRALAGRTASVGRSFVGSRWFYAISVSTFMCSGFLVVDHHFLGMLTNCAPEGRVASVCVHHLPLRHMGTVICECMELRLST